MKLYLLLASFSSVLITGTNGQYNNGMPPPPPAQAQAYQQAYGPAQPRPAGPLNFQQSVAQARDEIRRIFAKDRPVQDTVANMEEYYEGVIEANRRDMHPRGKLRKPCKVLPDPDPGFANPVLDQTYVPYVPLRRDEEFIGEFAPPLKLSGAELQYGSSNYRNYQGVGVNNYPRNGPNNYPGNYPPPPAVGVNNYPPPAVANYKQDYVNPFGPPPPKLVTEQTPLVGVPVFYTQTQTYYVTNRPDRGRNTRRKRDEFDDFNDPFSASTNTKTDGFFGNMGNWFGGSATRTRTGTKITGTPTTNFSQMQASLSSVQASLSSHLASLSSASISASFSASLAARSVSVASEWATATISRTRYHDYY